MEDDKRIPYFLLGLGIGTALGVLFAPKAGPETREFLLARADDSKEFLKRKTVELKDNATEIVDRGKQAITKQKDNLSAAVEAGKQAYREATTAQAPAPVVASDDMIEGV
jgi:gas vesicle protein